MTTSGKKLNVKLEDKTNGQLFANCPVDAYPGVAIEPVSDSSRYFVLRIIHDDGRHAFIGVGFGDRSDSFDMNVALQDHFKWVKNEEQIEKEKIEPKPQLDLGFKEGETIKINMKITVSRNSQNFISFGTKFSLAFRKRMARKVPVDQISQKRAD